MLAGRVRVDACFEKHRERFGVFDIKERVPAVGVNRVDVAPGLDQDADGLGILREAERVFAGLVHGARVCAGIEEHLHDDAAFGVPEQVFLIVERVEVQAVPDGFK